MATEIYLSDKPGLSEENTGSSEMCRICGKFNFCDVMIPIFSSEECETYPYHNISNIIEKFLPIQITIEDSYSKCICKSCANTLLLWRELIQTCIKTNDILQCNLHNIQHGTSQNQNTAVRATEMELHNNGLLYLHSQDKMHPTNMTNQSEKQIIQCDKGSKLEQLEMLYSQLSSVYCTMSKHIEKDHSKEDDSYQSEDGYSDVESQISRFSPNENNIYKREKRKSKLKKKKSTVTLMRKSLICHFCELVFKSKKSLSLHKKMHDKHMFLCKICSSNFPNKDDYDFHLATEHPDAPSDSKPPFIRHKDKIIDYNEIEKVKVIVAGVTYYKCQVCGKNLQRLYSYLLHATIHTGEKEFVCHLCGKQFRLSSTLRVHMKYTHEGKKDASCDLCGKEFATRKNMIQHRRIHTGERPYICQECGKSFKQSASLYIHKRTHTDNFPFECNQCNTRYRIKSQLKYHMIKHTGENPFPCEVCGKACATMSHLNYHKKCAHIKGKPFSCTQCDKAFRQKKYLRQHMKCCHKP